MTRLRFVGPGLIWAMMAVGQTHVVLSTYAGARFGFELLWMVVLAHVLAYPVFEYGARYSVATGESLNHAYLQMRGARWVMIPFLGLTLLLLAPLLFASMGSVTASVLLAAFPTIGFGGWMVVIAVGTLLLIETGRYAWLERLNIAMAFALLVSIGVAFSLSPPAFADWSAGLRPGVSEAALLTLVALMRLPNDPASSLLLSSWALEHIHDDGAMDRAETMRGILLGFRAGYALSLVVAVVFLSLGATVLRPLDLDLEGVDLALGLSGVFTETVGAWTFPFFIAIAFVSLYAGFYAAAEGTGRILTDLVARLRRQVPESMPAWLAPSYRLFAVGTGVVVAIGIERPAFLVLLAVSMGLIGFPLYYALNLFAVTRMIEPRFRPSRANVALATAGMVFAVTGGVLFVVTRLGG